MREIPEPEPFWKTDFFETVFIYNFLPLKYLAFQFFYLLQIIKLNELILQYNKLSAFSATGNLWAITL